MAQGTRPTHQRLRVTDPHSRAKYRNFATTSVAHRLAPAELGKVWRRKGREKQRDNIEKREKEREAEEGRGEREKGAKKERGRRRREERNRRRKSEIEEGGKK